MSNKNNLQKALLLVEKEEAQKYNDIFESPEPHTFSKKYLRRRKDIIDIASGRTIEPEGKQYKRVYRISFRTILVAALVMIMATITVIAVTKPHIYYVIKEKIDNWRITFIDEDTSDNENGGFVAVKPQLPEGFKIVLEEELEDNYFLSIENAEGDIINYDQRLPEGTTISIDSEHSENKTETINGSEVVISKEGDTITYICNDGKYIYHIHGNADEKLLKEMMMSVID